MRTPFGVVLLLGAASIVVAASGAFAQNLYLVEGHSLDAGPLLDPMMAPRVIETQILASFERILQLEKDGAILAGGLHAGARAGTYIFKAKSNEELNGILQSIPFWPIVEWKVTPLQSTQSRLAQDKKVVEMMKAGGK